MGLDHPLWVRLMKGSWPAAPAAVERFRIGGHPMAALDAALLKRREGARKTGGLWDGVRNSVGQWGRARENAVIAWRPRSSKAIDRGGPGSIGRPCRSPIRRRNRHGDRAESRIRDRR